jgi:NAD(P)-dependent dehydrogenase (short-subunit alcohol dehydrogenase family)
VVLRTAAKQWVVFDMVPFHNQVALITGAGSGIGRQLALTLADEGATIAAVDLHPEPLVRLAEELAGKKSAWAVADVTDRNALKAAVSQLGESLGPIDLLIANAGIGLPTSALDFRSEDFEAVIRVNLVGVANSIDAVLPGMLARKRGHLVGISSLASFRGLPHMAGYCASKAGVNALLDSMRVELKAYGIAVTTICPGWVRTPMTTRIEAPLPNLLEVEKAVRHIVGAIRKRTPFFAFPRPSALRVRLMGWLPCGLSDGIVCRMLRKLAEKRTGV